MAWHTITINQPFTYKFSKGQLWTKVKLSSVKSEYYSICTNFHHCVTIFDDIMTWKYQRLLMFFEHQKCSLTHLLSIHKKCVHVFFQKYNLWYNGYSHGLQNRSTRVRTLVALLRSLSDKYPWERYEPSYPPSYGLNSPTTVLLGERLWH